MKFRTQPKLRDGLKVKYRDGSAHILRTPTPSITYLYQRIIEQNGFALMSLGGTYNGWEKQKDLLNPRLYTILE